MNNTITRTYVEKLISIDYEDDRFEQYVDVFSKYLAYINPDYQYNGTYLLQYLGSFKELVRMIKKKNILYLEIFRLLKELDVEFDLTCDQSYIAKSSNSIGLYDQINGDKILKEAIEIKVMVTCKDEDYSFCKEYQQLEENLPQKVRDDFIEYLKIK